MTDTKDTEEVAHPFLRFRDIIPAERMANLRVALVGAGGIGAPAALSLAKMGVSHLEIWDPDTIGGENIGPQMYPRRAIGKFKVNTLKSFLRGQADWCKVTAHPELYTENTICNADVIIAAVDSFQARKTIWSTVDRSTLGLYVDPRMGAEVLTIHSVHPAEDAEWYEPTMEGRPVEAKCTAKATFHCGLIAGGLVAQAVKAWIVEERRLAEYTIDLRFLSMLGMTVDQAHEHAAAKAEAEAEAEAEPVEEVA
jgi:hypothetical protein